MIGERENAQRRLLPRIIDTDWLVLRALRDAIARKLQTAATPGMTAIDLGCGTQPYRSLIEAAQVRYLGADLGAVAEIAIAENGRAEAESGIADLVLSFQVLEHVGALQTYLSECRRLLKPDGRLILSTHGTWLYHPHPEDHRRWTREGLVSELKGSGFAVDECEALVGPLAWTTLIRLTSFVFALRKIPLIGGMVAACLAAVMNLRAVLEDKLTPQWVRDDNACVYFVTARAVSPA
jgi:SAM-dependent methyltransferase